jgi:hypothetical protein
MAVWPYVQAHENGLTFCAYKKSFFFFHRYFVLIFWGQSLVIKDVTRLEKYQLGSSLCCLKEIFKLYSLRILK